VSEGGGFKIKDVTQKDSSSSKARGENLIFKLNEVNGTFRGDHSITLNNHEGKQESWFVSVTAQIDGRIESIDHFAPNKVFENCDLRDRRKTHSTEILTIKSGRKIRVNINTEGHKRYPPSANRIYGDIEIIGG